MLKKFVLGLVFAVSGLLVWSCGDGTVDPLSDGELLMINRFDPCKLDYDELIRIVQSCGAGEECGVVTGKAYKGGCPDAKVYKDSAGNTIVVEGDSAFFVHSTGRKLPIFNFSSDSSDDDDDVSSSGSGLSSGSAGKSSAAGYDIDEYIDDDGSSAGSGSGSGTGEVNHDRSSSSGTVSGGSSSSVDLSFLSSSSGVTVLSSSTVVHVDPSSSSKGSSSSVDLSWLNSSSSSLGVASSSSIDNGVESSSSKIVIVQSSVSRSSSSVSEYVLSSSSTAQHGGGGGTDAACGANTVSGTCVANPSPGFRNEVVTYTFTPDGNHTCDAFDDVKWYVNEYLDEGAYSPTTGEPMAYWADPSSSSRASFSFDVKYSSIGDKKSVVFSMGGQQKTCNAVTIKRRCESNTYTCNTVRTSATNNMWKNDVTYKWTFSQGASNCLDVSSVNWNGSGLTINGNTATKTYPKGTTTPVNESVSLTVIDEVGSHTVNCTPNATAVYVPDVAPTFNVSNMTMPVNYTVKVIPSSVAGCSYDVGNKCSYNLEDENGAVVASASGGYVSGALNSFSGESDEVTVNYTLTLTNYIGSSEPKIFSITYVMPTPMVASTTSTSYAPANAYSVSTAASISENKFKCVTSSAPNDGLVIGYFNGTEYKAYPGQWGSNSGYAVSASSTYTFVIFNDAPSNIQCYLSW